MNSAMTRRATSVSMASSAGSSNGGRAGGGLGHRSCAAVQPVRRTLAVDAGTRSARTAPRPACRSKPGSAPALGGRVVGQAGPLGHDPAQLADLQLGPLVAEQRQGDPLAPDVGQRDLDREQPLVVERRAEDGPPLGAMTSEPPQNEIDSSTPTRLQKTTNEVVSWAYVRISVRHDVAVPSPTSFVAARSRPGDDETLTRIWAPSRASSCGTGRCQKSSQMAIPIPTPSRDGHGPQQVAGGEEAPLVEQPVGRQEELAVDVPDLAVLEQGGRDEQPVIGRFLDERDDRRQAARRRRRARARRGSSSRIATSDARSWSW